MQTFSSKLSSLRPNSLFSFGNGMTSLELKSNIFQNDIIDRDNTFVGSDSGIDHLVPYWIKPAIDYVPVSNNYLINPLSENEVFSDVDNSLIAGRSLSYFTGYHWKLKRPNNFTQVEHDEEIKERLTSNKFTTYYWQMNFSKDLESIPYTQFDYEKEESDDYAIVMYDIDHPEDSYSIVDTFSAIDSGKEIWTGTFSPKLYDGGVRYISIDLIELRTGRVFDSCKWLFSRDAQLRDGVQGTVISNIPENPFKAVYNTYNPLNFDDLPTGSDPKIEKVVFNDVYDLFLNNPTDPALPAGRMKITVNVPKARKRSTKSDQFIANRTNNHDLINFMNFKFVYNKSSNLINLVDVATATSNTIFSLPATTDTTYLFGVQVSYEVLPGNNLVTRQYDYNMKYAFKIGCNKQVYEFEFTKRFIGNILATDRSTGDIKYILGPCDLNMPFTTGQKLYTSSIVSKKKKEIKLDNKPVVIDIIDYCKCGANTSFVYIDNIARFENRDLSDFDDLHYRMYNQYNIIIDKYISNYWACDDYHESFITTKFLDNNSGAATIIKNSKPVVGGANYQIYSDMYILGQGKISKSTLNHKSVKSCINFEKNIGVIKTQNVWNASGYYTINFWFRSTQQTDGMIISDFDKETIGNGIALEIKDGFLQVSYNQNPAFIYTGKTICDGEFHMITIVHSLARSENITRSDPIVTVYIDGQMQVKILQETSKLINQTSRNLQLNYNVYFMGHPLYKNVKGSLSKIGFYKFSATTDDVLRLYDGDLEFIVKGTILSRNTPVRTEVRMHSARTGDMIGNTMSDQATGEFIIRTFDNSNMYITVLGLKVESGIMQTVGPVAPVSIG